MNLSKPIRELGKAVSGNKDSLVASILALLALVAYVRTLAPDILYGDSAEFQCQAYTLGITHSTGYSTYLFLGRLIGLLPVQNPAWRISLLSALCAALTVGGIYLLARHFTRSRIGAALGSVALGFSYTFWSQAVIPEVYTPGMAFLVAILLLLFRWQAEPRQRNLSLLAAAMLAGIGFGVHASVWLVAPPAVVLVLWTLHKQHASRPEWLRSLSAGLVGAAVGLTVVLITFLISDWLNPPTSFIRTTLEPSRVFWNLQPDDFDSPIKRLKLTVISAQWGNALFPGEDFSAMRELGDFISRLTTLEFSPVVVLFALIGFAVMLRVHAIQGAFYLGAFLFSTWIIMNYRVSDKYVFYLSLYIPLVVAVGAGMGSLLEWIYHRLEGPVTTQRVRLLVSLLTVLFLVSAAVLPGTPARWQALQSGTASFVMEDYAFPAKNLSEPRMVAQTRLAGMADNAVFVLDWRAMYTTAYLAHVEKGMTNTLFFEAMPYGSDGEVASTLIAELTGYLEEGRPVFAEQKFPGLEQSFRIVPAAGNLYKLSLRK